METINNITKTASNAIWGTKGTTEEPQSGVQGDTSKGEPFDGGNMENTENKGVESAAGPTAEKDSSVIPGDSTKGQNDVRDPENPQTSEEHAEKKKDVDDTHEAPKLDGPGPKPLDVVAREHGGDAGSGEKVDAPAGESGDGAGDEEEEDGPQKKSKGEGTGEKYVKSTGLQADGGDFDATRPGAGREADRLLEEKGIHPGGSNKPDPEETGGGATPEKKEKRSLGEKIKAKLHKSTPS